MADMKGHVGKNKKKIKNKSNNEEKITLELVQKLGGNKKDLELLEGIDSGEEFAPGKDDDFETDPVNKDELRDFIESLEIEQYRPKFTPQNDDKPKKIKLLKMPEKGEETESKLEEKTTPVKSAKKNKNKYKVQDEEVSSTSADAGLTLDVSFVNNYHPRKYLLVKPGGQWLHHVNENEPKVWEPASDSIVEKLEKYATKLLDDEVALYRKQQDMKKSSDASWLRTVLTSGTSSDKLAALTLVIQESPVHNLANLDHLISMVSKKAHRVTLSTLDRLKELFLSDLLPENRKLKTFQQHAHIKLEVMASGNKDTRDKILVMWYYEHQLKHRYSSFVQALQVAAQDNVQATKKKAVDAIFELLSSRPEQEKSLLTILVNKVGDPDYKVAARCSHLLTKLVEKHPNMKQVVVLEVERLMYRPNMKPKAQYYAVCFLNQLILSHQEKQLASRLISIYFSFFKAFVKKSELESKMLSALLAGVNRAYAFAKVEKEKMQAQMDMMYKVLHSLSFNTSIQALMLLQQVASSGDSMSDRYYTALYKRMVDPQLRTSSRQALFLNLLFKSIKKDENEKRVKAFVKRLLQVCCQHSPPFICGALVLLSELLKEQPGMLNLQTIFEDLDEEEHFKDAPDDEETESPTASAAETVLAPSQSLLAATGSWVHRANLRGKNSKEDYDMMQRNPLYCRAEHECIWELSKLTQHYHPSVVLFASNLIRGERIHYPGDPMQDFTLIRFLDRFVYRNPKSKQSLPATQSGKLLMSKNKRYKAKGMKALAVNSEEYMMKGESSIPVDEKYLYRYFVQQAPKKDKKEDEEADSDASDVSDEEFDDYLDQFEKGLMEEAELDFAGDLGRLKGMRKRRKKKKPGDEDDDDAEDNEDVDDLGGLSDEEVEFSDDEDMRNMFDQEMLQEGDMDEEDIAFSDDDDDFGDVDFTAGTSKQKKRKHGGEDGEDLFPMADKCKKKGKRDNDGALFAAAEEFADVIDKNMGAGFDMIGSEALANKDNAHAKQLKWEQERARKLESKDWRFRKGKSKPFKGKLNFRNKKGKKK